MDPVLLEDRLVSMLDDLVDIGCPEHRPHVSSANWNEKTTRHIRVKGRKRNADTAGSCGISNKVIMFFHSSLPQKPEHF